MLEIKDFCIDFLFLFQDQYMKIQIMKCHLIFNSIKCLQKWLFRMINWSTEIVKYGLNRPLNVPLE